MPKRKKADDETACVIPHAAQPEALAKYLVKAAPYDGAEEIRAYVERQSPQEKVTYLERVATERVYANDHETWDVHTTGERYWVVTLPTNLYPQRLFPSADYTLSFHIGLCARVLARREARASDDQQDRVAGAWRRWAQIGQALDTAREAEDYQAIGMRCRECLLALVREISDESIVPPGEEKPKAADFIHWTEFIARALASGSGAKEVRSYLRDTARAAWQFVNWLTHAAHATRFDAELALEATHSALATFSMVVLRFERGVPAACPQCASYQITSRYIPELSASMPYASLCQSCGWHTARVDAAGLEE